MVIRHIKHVVPFVGLETVPNKKSVQTALSASVRKIKDQLHLDYSNNYNNYGAQSGVGELKSFNVPVFEKVPEIEVTQVIQKKKFEFDPSKYSFSKAEIKKAPEESKPSRFPIIITKNEPICKDYKGLKGPNNDLYNLASMKGLTKQKPLYRCKWFQLNYFHSTTFLGKIVKSRPAVMIVCHNLHAFNSDSIASKISLPPVIQNKSFVFKYATNRTHFKKLLRKHFLEAYLEDENFAHVFDGLYRFSSGLYPGTDAEKQDMVEHLKHALKAVSEMDLAKHEETSKRNESKLPTYEVQKLLRIHGLTSTVKFSKNNKKRPFTKSS